MRRDVSRNAAPEASRYFGIELSLRPARRVELPISQLVSHASADGYLSISVAVDWTHLVLVALWVGMVFVASIVNLRQFSQGAD